MPRKSRKVHTRIDHEPVALADTLEAVAERHDIKPASESLQPLDPPEVSTAVVDDEPPALGPKKRHPGEERAVFVAPEAGFRLTQTPESRAFKFADRLAPSSEEKAKLRDAGLSYSTREKAWVGPNTYQVREATDRLALELSGKNSEGRVR